jgi:hypothetical protein
MTDSEENKNNFLGRYGNEHDITGVIRKGIEPAIRSAMNRNPAFSRAHHEQMLRSGKHYVRHLTVYSPHATPEDLHNIIHNESGFVGVVNTAIQRPKAPVDDIIHVAMSHEHTGVRGNAMHALHKRNALTPELLRKITNQPGTPSVPMHILNSVLPKDHEPLTSTDVHNHMVKHAGGTLK